MSTKSSSSTAPRPIAAASQTGVFSERQETKYERSFEGLVRTRAYARGPKIGAQRMPRVVQRLLCPNTHDLVENSVFVILRQLLLRLNEDKSIPTMVMETREACAKNRSAICKEKLGMSVEKGKEALHTVLFGGQIPLTLSGNAFMQKMQQTSIFLRWTACSLMKEVYDAVGSLPDKTNPQSSTLHYLYACIEDHILETWAASVERRSPGHLSLHFDGLRVGQFSTGVDVASLCQEAMNVVQEKTGFKVNIIEKQHYLFRELCRTPVESVEEPLHDTTLHQPGNCIPLAIARLFPDRLEDIRAVLREDTHKNKEASLRHSRCYASVLASALERKRRARA